MKARLSALVLVCVLVAGACGTPNATEPATTSGTVVIDGDFGTIQVLAGDDPPVPFTYVLREAQIKWAGDIFWMFWQALGGENHPVITADGWDADHQTIQLSDKDGLVCAYGHGCRQITFHGMAFDPEGEFSYGKTTVLSTIPKEFQGSGYLIDATASDSPIPFTRTEEITREQERSTETTETIEQNLEIKAGQKGTVGGEGFGASFEASLEETWGVTNTEEKTQAESESKSVTQSVEISVTTDPGHKNLVLISTNTANTSTPFAINAAMVYDKISVTWVYGLIGNNTEPYDWQYRGKAGEWVSQITDHRNKGVSVSQSAYYFDDGECANKTCVDYAVYMEFDGIDDMIGKLSGKDPDWPGTLNHHGSGYLSKFVERVFDRDSRFISMSGVQHRTFDEVADYSVTDVTGQNNDDILNKHGMDEGRIVTGGGS